jgi:hypothetical protein
MNKIILTYGQAIYLYSKAGNDYEVFIGCISNLEKEPLEIEELNEEAKKIKYRSGNQYVIIYFDRYEIKHF